MPERAHPVAKFIYTKMREQGVTHMEMEYCSGVQTCTLKATRTSTTPGLNTADAWLGVLGFSLLPVPNPETLDPALRAELEALVVKYDLDSKLNIELIAAAVGRYPHTGRSWQAYREKLAKARALSDDPEVRKVAEADLRRFERGREKYQKLASAKAAA
ncbi:hypothetical protein ACFO8O_10675 [Hephaestia sp. GCM10023244]